MTSRGSLTWASSMIKHSANLTAWFGQADTH